MPLRVIHQGFAVQRPDYLSTEVQVVVHRLQVHLSCDAGRIHPALRLAAASLRPRALVALALGPWPLLSGVEPLEGSGIQAAPGARFTGRTP